MFDMNNPINYLADYIVYLYQTEGEKRCCSIRQINTFLVIKAWRHVTEVKILI